MPHGIVSVRFGHAVPPLEAGRTIVRVRVMVPEPQVAEQAEKFDQEDTTQLSGHWVNSEQLWLLELAPQGVPPLDGCCKVGRVRVCVPVPQRVEHAEATHSP